jgi:hypothetical protein
MKVRTQQLTYVAVGAALVVALAGCGASERDQNVTKKAERDTGPALIINEPQGFRNVSFKCFGPNGVYVTSRGDWSSSGSQGPELPSAVYVVASDPNCKSPGAPAEQPTGQPTR